MDTVTKVMPAANVSASVLEGARVPEIEPVPEAVASPGVVVDEAPADNQRNKKIILLSDGTGNSERSPFKTNVWRTYQALRLAPGRQIARYDDGVGTSRIKPLAMLGGAFGWGLKRGVIDLYKFLCRAYEEGDEIYAFGFSRGAFTIRVLIGLITSQDLVPARHDDGSNISEEELTRRATAAYRVYRNESFRAPLAQLGRFMRDAFLKLRDEVLLGLRPYTKEDNTPITDIRFLGLWDTVDAYGLPIRELKNAVDRFIWPLSFRGLELSDKVRCARHALSLDDERATFHPLMWDERGEAEKAKAGLVPENRIQQLWFAGAHANVGGGYPDDSLAYVPLLWILEEAQKAGLEFEDELLRVYRAFANLYGKIYDSRSGLASFYRYSPRRVDRWPEAAYTSRALVAWTVFERIRQGRYAPIAIHGPIQCVSGPDASDIEERRYNSEAMELVLDTVWWRCISYWTLLFSSALILGFPWLASIFSSPDDEHWGEVLNGFFIFSLLKLVAPAFAGRWIDAFAQHPLYALAFLAFGGAAFFWGSQLRDLVIDRARFAWQTDYAAPIDRARWLREATRHPSSVRRPRSHTARGFPLGGSDMALRIARFFRANGRTRAVQTFVVKQAIPFFFILLICLTGFYAVNWLAFAAVSAAGKVCAPTDASKLISPNPGAIEKPRFDFDIANSCFATGIRLAAGAKYRITFSQPTDWHDGTIDVAELPVRLPNGETRPRLPTEGYGTFETGVPRYMLAGVPMLRVAGENWLKPIARLGLYGHEEYPLGPHSTLIEPQRTGELFLYVNDAVIGVPGLWDIFYPNNRGSVTVEIQAIEPPRSD
jgi:uncharacterized protein (DUF2235 family)